MTRPPTRAELQAKADYWQKMYRELGEQKDKEIAELHGQVEHWMRQEVELHDQLRLVRGLWNEWTEVEKGDKDRPAVVRFPDETLQKLLSLLHP